ncbi:MazG family protein [Chthonomonas calidirosea]|uniref:MazG family protein n=1 Tax=Chthonomonas calidirosea (strain DSM 23976 / ICMP 18418 / T49) TaxID=1303518 RepID=S0EU62_CHTCT|nr:nucleoside triphosphate pyrophosphohydrolase [Chthonomonas calidirosea]CCW34809.1 MazG family protein [Chthonomonas calidirosea T49]CEK13734.1 MazG family protein [Chthonomonas calidirosea]
MVTLIGLGPGDPDLISRGAERTLREASAQSALYLRTERHPCVAALKEWGLTFETFDSFYDTATSFEEVYRSIVNRLLDRVHAGDSVAYAVPGHPLLGEESVRLLLERLNAENIAYRIVSSCSFIEAVLAAAHLPLSEGCDVRDALSLQLDDRVSPEGYPLGGRIDTSRGLLLFQVFDRASASHAKLALMRYYPDDWQVLLVRNAGVPAMESVQTIPLHQLDRLSIDHLTAVYVPPLPPSLRPKDFYALVGVMARLRAPDGCPWDREQTHTTLKRYFVEETYEVLDAIDANDPNALCEELGDALLQTVFHAQLAREEGLFTIDDVTAHIVEKLVRRHPHVFGTTEVADSAEVLRNWERIKQTEKSENVAQAKSLLDGIPKGLPALMYAMELSKRVVKVGFEWPGLAQVLAKVDEEWEELKRELTAAEPDQERVAAELGDLLFTLVQVARKQNLDAEDALRTMLRRFEMRFRYMERCAAEMGRSLKEMNLEELDTLWEEAKRQESL